MSTDGVMTAQEFEEKVLKHKCGLEHMTGATRPPSSVHFHCGECHASCTLNVWESRCMDWPDSIRRAAYDIVKRTRGEI